jgi:hypothetical protein
MTTMSDTLTVGLVLVLLFGSIALYLYTRIQQSEQKISLLESILLDLKMSSEIKTYTEIPASETPHMFNEDKYTPFEDDSNDTTDQNSIARPSSPANSVSSKINDSEQTDDITDYKTAIADAITDDIPVDEIVEHNAVMSVNYESMTLKELQTLAKTRGIVGANTMKKGMIIEALKTSDKSQTNMIEPGSGNSMGSFLETSSSLE